MVKIQAKVILQVYLTYNISFLHKYFTKRLPQFWELLFFEKPRDECLLWNSIDNWIKNQDSMTCNTSTIHPAGGALWSQTLWNVFWKKNYSLALVNLCYCNFMEKSEKFHALTFGKTSFWVHSRAFLPPKPEYKIFTKKLFRSILSLLM